MPNDHATVRALQARQSETRMPDLVSQFGPWAVVTGASSGLGRRIALGLARSGLNVVVVARRAPELETLAAEIRGTGREARCLSIDLATPEGPGVLDAATAELDVGLVVLNAGFGTAGGFLSSDLATELEMVRLNCSALLASAHSFGGRLARRGRGGLTLIGSIVGFQGAPGSATYAATKAFVQSLGEALDVELGPLGVRVMVAAPGPTHTGFADRANMKMGNAMTTDEVADAIVNATGGRGTVFPGWLSKLLRLAFATVPRWIGTRILGKVMDGMMRR